MSASAERNTTAQDTQRKLSRSKTRCRFACHCENATSSVYPRLPKWIETHTTTICMPKGSTRPSARPTIRVEAAEGGRVGWP